MTCHPYSERIARCTTLMKTAGLDVLLLAKPANMAYYANILTPFSEQVTKKIQEVLAFNLPVDVICTSHGVVWRDNPVRIVQQYLKWADSYQENQITLVYDK